MIPFWPLGGVTQRIAYLAEGREVSYAELGERADRVARGLVEAGAARGKPVATLLTNGPAFVETLHAVLRLGAILMPLHDRLPAAELTQLLADREPALIVHDERHAATATHLGPPAVDVSALTDGSPLPDAVLGDYDATAAILFTSGSTDAPHRVNLSTGNLLWSALASAAVLGTRPDDRWLSCLTTAHVGGLSIFLRSAVYGTAVVIHDGFDETAVNRAIDEDGVTIVSLVAAGLARVLADRGARTFPPSLRCVLVGGGPIPDDLIAECARRHVPLAPSYGLTEASSQVATRAPFAEGLHGAGRPLPGTLVKLDVDDEILVKGPTVSRDALSPDGWLHTGDLGHLDEHGCVFIQGRSDDLIVSGGENVQPLQVEAALSTHPAVAEVAVAGVPDGSMGQAVVAWVRLKPGRRAKVEELRTHVRQTLAGFKVPRRVHLVERLPTTPLGKIARRELREPG